MIIEISLVVIALLLFAIYVSQKADRNRAERERKSKIERQFQAHEADAAIWERVVEARDARMEAWDSTNDGQRCAYLSEGLNYVGEPDAQGIYWLSFPGADMHYSATEAELTKMRAELSALDAKRRAVWQQIVADLPLCMVTEDPRGVHRYPSTEQVNAYRSRF
jgi:hypothetical protein